MKIRTKLWHFPRLFWSSENRRCVMFELAPGPRLALGAPGSLHVELFIIFNKLLCFEEFE